mgnify:FL=1
MEIGEIILLTESFLTEDGISIIETVGFIAKSNKRDIEISSTMINGDANNIVNTNRVINLYEIANDENKRIILLNKEINK